MRLVEPPVPQQLTFPLGSIVQRIRVVDSSHTLPASVTAPVLQDGDGDIGDDSNATNALGLRRARSNVVAATGNVYVSNASGCGWADVFDQGLCTSIVRLELEQFGEKLDWIRAEAGTALSSLVQSEDSLSAQSHCSRGLATSLYKFPKVCR